MAETAKKGVEAPEEDAKPETKKYINQGKIKVELSHEGKTIVIKPGEKKSLPATIAIRRGIPLEEV